MPETGHLWRGAEGGARPFRMLAAGRSCAIHREWHAIATAPELETLLAATDGGAQLRWRSLPALPDGRHVVGAVKFGYLFTTCLPHGYTK